MWYLEKYIWKCGGTGYNIINLYCVTWSVVCVTQECAEILFLLRPRVGPGE